jgi:hypothetical protein
LAGRKYKIVTTLTDPIEVTTERFTVFSWRGESFNVGVFDEGLFYLEHEHGGTSYYVLSHVMEPTIFTLPVSAKPGTLGNCAIVWMTQFPLSGSQICDTLHHPTTLTSGKNQ